jgi:SAM-dependent methyltransferase
MLSSPEPAPVYFSHPGYCPVCEKSATFVADGPCFRDTLRCKKCQSLPRNRALMHVLATYFPQWRRASIHESSPGWDLVSRRLLRECAAYLVSQFDPAIGLGTIGESLHLPCKTFRNENLESQTFSDGTFDLVITQDVFEHIFNPGMAIKEIARTLKPGGATLMTVPLVQQARPSRRRAALVDGQVINVMEPQFHGNPVAKSGSLVTIDWGFDIVRYLYSCSGLSFILLKLDHADLGILGDLNEVLIGFKCPIPEL